MSVDAVALPGSLPADVVEPLEATSPGSPPPVPTLAIRRPRLEHMIDDHPERRVVLVHGPAGAGKTVLVAQWVAARRSRCWWITLDGAHDEPEVFLRRLAEAVALAAPGSNASTPGLGLAADPHRPFGAVVRHDGGAVDLVLDGVDRLRDRRCRHAVARLVEHPPAGVRVILVARGKPRLGIERARLRGDLVEVGPHALRFNRSEIDALAATWTGRSVEAATLEQTTLGWAAGLRLAQMEAMVAETVPAALRESDGFAGEYTREELIEGSPPELQTFLEVTCWLPLVTAPLCAALADQPVRRPPLTLSEVQALPLFPVASRPGAFRYPPVLALALQREYRRRDRRATRRAQCRAAEASRRCGELDGDPPVPRGRPGGGGRRHLHGPGRDGGVVSGAHLRPVPAAPEPRAGLGPLAPVADPGRRRRRPGRRGAAAAPLPARGERR